MHVAHSWRLRFNLLLPQGETIREQLWLAAGHDGDVKLEALLLCSVLPQVLCPYPFFEYAPVQAEIAQTQPTQEYSRPNSCEWCANFVEHEQHVVAQFHVHTPNKILGEPVQKVFWTDSLFLNRFMHNWNGRDGA